MKAVKKSGKTHAIFVGKSFFLLFLLAIGKSNWLLINVINVTTSNQIWALAENGTSLYSIVPSKKLMW